MRIKLTCIVLFVIIIFSCKNKNNTSKNEILYIPKTISSVPIMELEDLEIKNKIIHTQFYQDHITTFAKLLNEDINIIVTGFNLGVSGYKNRKNIIHVATFVWGVSSLISGKKNDFKSIENFKDKIILTPFAKSPLDLQLRAIIKYYNLNDSIKINHAVIQQAVPLLIQGKTDGICVPEPIASKLVNQGFNRVFKFSDYWKLINNNEPRSPQVSIYANKNFVLNNRKFCLALIKTLDKKIKQIKKEKNYQQKYLNLFNLDESTFEQAMKNTLFEIVNYNKTKQLCNDLLKKIEYKEEIDDNFFLSGY